MKKRTTKSRRARTKPAVQSSASPAMYIWAAIAAIAAIIIVISIIILMRPRTDTLAVVNGEPVTQETLDFQYNLLPDSYKQTFSRDQVLEQIIDEELVVQAAEREGLSVDDAQVNARVQEILGANELSIADLQANLAEFNVTTEQFEELIRRQLLISAYLNRTLPAPQADNETLNALYSASRSQFTVPEQVSVQHVLIASQRTDAALLAKSIYDEARAGADFCELAANNSDDRGSRDRCGAYTFARGAMDPVFEEASFTMKDGEIGMVQTQFGYHVIKRINLTPEHILPFEEVKLALEEQYNAADRSLQYRKLISSLRSAATIEYANGTRIMPATPNVVSPTGNVVETPEAPVETPVEETPAAEVPADTTDDTVVVVPQTPTEEIPETPAETPVEQPVEETPVDEIPAEETSAADGIASDDLMGCIASRATLYGTSWSTETQDALRLFSRNGIDLEYTQCDAAGASCPGITAYPTWMIGGEQYPGRMTLEQLKNAADC